MKILKIVLSMIFSSTAFAHIEPGTWMGKTDQNADCGFLAHETYFEDGIKHPLNERIRIQAGQDTFVVRHPFSIHAGQATIQFNHDLFEGVLATSTGARALLITMQHDSKKEGPVSFQWIEHHWKSNQKTSIVCRNLKHQKIIR